MVAQNYKPMLQLGDRGLQKAHGLNKPENNSKISSVPTDTT
jgi:hypothetical protein